MLVTGLAIVLLGGVAVVVISQATSDGGPTPSAPAREAGLAAPVAAPIAASPPLPSIAAKAEGVRVMPQPVRYGPPPPTPPPGSWEAVRLAPSTSLGTIGAALRQWLADSQGEALAACFDEDAQARFGTAPYTVSADLDDEETAGAAAGITALVLHLETSQGEVRIVDAPLRTRGGASDGLIACSQQVLRGKTFRAAAAKPGSRYRVVQRLGL